MEKERLKVLVSSSVYGIEELLDILYVLLTNYNYEVWMSHKGTMPVFSSGSAFENCLAAVEKCDMFLGLITPHYGSGVSEADNLSITHLELRKAIERNIPRWLLVHDHVVFARKFLEHLRTANGRKFKNRPTMKKNSLINDLRVIDMYEEAILSHTGLPVEERKGNWVQKYVNPKDAKLFATAQFFRYKEVESFVQENLNNSDSIAKKIAKKVI